MEAKKWLGIEMNIENNKKENEEQTEDDSVH